MEDDHDGDDWDNVPPPQLRSDRIQRITSPDGTLRRPPPASAAHHPSTNSLSRNAQAQAHQQQLQLAMMLLQQQQQQMGFRTASDGFYEQHPPPPPPNHLASLRRQAQIMALQAAHTGSLPRGQHQIFSIPPSPTSSRGMRYRSPANSLPPTSGPLRPVMSPNLSTARRLSQARLDQQQQQHLDPRMLDTLSRRNIASMGPYWGQQYEKGPFDPFVAAAHQQSAIYSGDGSTSSYARVNHVSQRQTYPPQLSSAGPQNVDHMYSLQHDENTSLTSQKTSRTQASMLTKSGPTPSGSGSGASASGSGSGSTPLQQKQSSTEATGSTTISASAKYAEYISNLQKYQHPPPSKRHVTFIKYRGRQCTIAMLVVFAILVIGLVVAPVVYFTAFANKATASNSGPPPQLTNFINGQIALDTTHGTYANLLTDPGRPPDSQLKRVQRDMEDLLKDVLRGPGGFTDNDINSVAVLPPQRPDAHQIFLRFQVLLKTLQPLDAAEAKTSKAFAGATTTDLVGMRLKDIPIVANSLFFRAVAQTNGTATVPSPSSDITDTGNGRSFDLMQLDPTVNLKPVSRAPALNSGSSSVSVSVDKTAVTPSATGPILRVPPPVPSILDDRRKTSQLAPGPFAGDSQVTSTIQPVINPVASTPATMQQTPSTVARSLISTTTPQPSTNVNIAGDAGVETFGVGVGVHAGKTTIFPSSHALSGVASGQKITMMEEQRPVLMTTDRPVMPPTVPQMTKAMSDRVLSENSIQSGSRIPSSFEGTKMTGTIPFNSQAPFGTTTVMSQTPFQQNETPTPLDSTDNLSNQPAVNTTPKRTSPFNAFGNPDLILQGNQNTIPMSTNWRGPDNTNPPRPDIFNSPQFVQSNNPRQTNMQSQPSVFNLNMQNQPLQGVSDPRFPGGDRLNQGNNFQNFPGNNQQPAFSPNGNVMPGMDIFNRGPASNFNNGFRVTSPQQSSMGNPSQFGPRQNFNLNGFSQDDAGLSTPIFETAMNSSSATTLSSVSVLTPAEIISTTPDVPTTAQETASPKTEAQTASSSRSATNSSTSVANGTELVVDKREFSSQPVDANMPNKSPVKPVDDGQELPAFVDIPAAPVVISAWGNWTEWGSCSAPRCSDEGFQSRSRVCMSSIDGAAFKPDRDATCIANGGQPIETRPCICEKEVNTDDGSTSLMSADSTTGGPSPGPTTEEAWDDFWTASPQMLMTTTTTPKLPSYVSWSDWSDWSSCSIDPCQPNGIQTRHRTCQGDSQTVADNICTDQLEGLARETQSCNCPTTTASPIQFKITTPTYVRVSGQFLQPPRTFNMQVQQRPIQRRPTTKLPGTCSAFQKPCNNGQCILSYRICDGYPDCADGSDEPLGCGRCFSGEFKCTNGRCISETLVCDGTDNCGDGSDEYFC